MKTPKHAKEEDKLVPWIGTVKKTSKSNVTLEWMTKQDNGLWQTGLEGQERMARSEVLAKIPWNGEGQIPCEKDILKLGLHFIIEF